VISGRPFFPRSDLMNSVRLRAAGADRVGSQARMMPSRFLQSGSQSPPAANVPGITDSSVGNRASSLSGRASGGRLSTPTCAASAGAPRIQRTTISPPRTP